MSDFTYTGHYYDRPTGLSLAWYRAYDPNLGRWLSKDPIGLKGGTNLYGYVQNEPVNWIDPEGKLAWFAAAACLGGGCEALGAAALSAAIWTTATVGAVWGGLELGKWLQEKFNPEQQILIDIAKEAQKTGMSEEDAEALLELATEAGIVPVEDHRDTDHWVGGPHIRIGPKNHIPVDCK